ncbi:MAG: hypothetical protein FWE27_03370 [Defluviitaleaceae bacterium]|nr:hypothetical protein [Defluviitaleaceae bacterium]
MIQKKCKMLLVFIIALAILTPAIFYAQPEEARLVVSFDNVHTPVIDTSALDSLIEYAENVKAGVRISATDDGADIPITELWALLSVHTAFQNAINAAKGVLAEYSDMDVIGVFSPGESFDMNLRIENNPGFTNMAVRLFVPEGLELTHIMLDENFYGPAVLFPDWHDFETGAITTPIVGPRNAQVVFWGTGGDFIASNAGLLTYTFRVRQNAAPGKTNPITFAFADNIGYAQPSTKDGVLRDITPPGENGVIGSIYINVE